MLPIAFFTPNVALRIWTIINIGVIVIGVILSSRISGKDWLWTCLLLLGSGIALVNNFRFGQFYLMLTSLILFGYYFWRQRKYVPSGIMLGIGAALKYFPLIFLPLFMMRKQWKLVITCSLTVLTIYSIGLLVFGVETYKQFFVSVFAEHLSGNIQDPFSAALQSWNSLFHRLFMYDATLNPFPVFNSVATYQIARYSVYLTIFIVVCQNVYRLNKVPENDTSVFQFSLVSIAGMVLLPASATYHFLLLFIPLTLLLSREGSWNIWQRSLVGCYLIIAFLPYRFFRTFDGQGWWTIVAYPRLWAMTLMFVAACFYTRNVSQNMLRTEKTS